MTLLLHSLSRQLQPVRRQPQPSRSSATAAPARSSLTPESRGPDGVYDGYAEADVFEAWADVARHYQLDPA